MIGNFPDPYPDEIFYSICARYSDRMKYSFPNAVTKDLFGMPGKRAIVSFPTGLGTLVARLPPHAGYTVDGLIEQHTLLPLFQPFLPAHRAEIIREKMKDNQEGFIAGTLGLRAIDLPTACMRFCADCIEDDRKQFGEAYWHRTHQISGLLVCPHHTVYLRTCLPDKNENLNERLYYSLENFLDRGVHSASLETALERSRLGKIACDVLWLLQKNDRITNLTDIQKRYLYLLAENGFATYRGNVYKAKLIEAFKQFYNDLFLHALYCDIDGYDKDNWITRLPRAKRTFNPIRHILLIHFLGHSTQTFFELPPGEQDPFGSGPWPCLNSVCEHYGQEHLPTCEITYTKKNGKPKVSFSCECGFIYSRRGPDRSESDQFRLSRIEQFGHVWQAKLREIWEDSTISLSQKAHILGVNRQTVKRQAYRMQLPFLYAVDPILLSKPNPNDAHQSSSTSDTRVQEKYRAIWLTLREDHPEERVGQLKQKNHTAYKWLYHNDREWLRRHYPISQYPYNTPINWEQRDRQIALEAKEQALQIINTSVPPKWMTIHSILKGMKQKSNIYTNLYRLPLTAQVLAEFSETYEEFVRRRIQWLVECYRQEQRVPTRGQFIRRGHFYHDQERWVSVKEAIDDALRVLDGSNE